MSHTKLGAALSAKGVDFSVYSAGASAIDLCIFGDNGNQELCRLPMKRNEGDIWSATLEGAHAGTRYGYRANGQYEPDRGLWFDPSKLLVDPYAIELDRPFAYDPSLSAYSKDTAGLVPRAIVGEYPDAVRQASHFSPGGLIYEVNVRALTMLHPDIPEVERGTVKALAHPAIIAHLKKIGVSAIELMPITAWMDERHLPPLGLKNSWGYNPIALMALDPRLCPGGVRELAESVAALHAEGIGVILDLVFNHTAESDQLGPTVSMRGLDSLAYYRFPEGHPGLLVNDTGCGNTLACDAPIVHDLVLASLRHFVRTAGVDGFRFDLAPIMGRDQNGFNPDAALLKAIHGDPVLADRILIAEPWDIGPGGYQLGNFPPAFLEWNDRARDNFRMFWRGDGRKIGDLATALSGSSPIFGRNGASSTRTVNFIAAHDGFSVMDLVSYENKHNELNGEHNRDGHNENYSWNNGVEGQCEDLAVLNAREGDVRALLSTLFSSRGTIMLMAGDEMGRSQRGNNNAYAQDNALTWIDWPHIDEELLAHTTQLSAIRQRFTAFSETAFLTDGDVRWLTPDGQPMQVSDWENPAGSALVMLLETLDRQTGRPARVAVAYNRTTIELDLHLPGNTSDWKILLGSEMSLPARSVSVFVEDII
ncbi:glycogen debranching protein GlgX [Rhizobium sp. KVB221]|uniref:Glycogen debranching protein GlgX n=1 Tax=Rhizobium setariae TaxID=2801340 RepID=A0A936YPS6_9HYPH|nr:glycogen debranching protein GlgX [Rhizobium setariae]MBL0372221.1 glycogen debranching protein GlgX [Rhizobium setariae]